MKLDRLATIARIDQLLSDAETQFEAGYQRKVTEHEQAVQDWRDKTAPKLLAELRKAVDHVRRGRYPREVIDRLEQRRYGRSDLMTDPGLPPKRGDYKPSVKLTRLRAILADATTDEYVTTAALRELGFSPSLFIAD